MVGGAEPHDAIVADFNGDGLKDFAVANFGALSFSVFLNHGNMTFTATDFGADLKPTDLTMWTTTGVSTSSCPKRAAVRASAATASSRAGSC